MEALTGGLWFTEVAFSDLLHLIHPHQKQLVLALLICVPLIHALPRQPVLRDSAVVKGNQQIRTRIST
jgi:hypothetical protein